MRARAPASLETRPASVTAGVRAGWAARLHFQDHETSEAVMHAGCCQRMANGDQAPVPWRLSHSVIFLAGPAAASSPCRFCAADKCQVCRLSCSGSAEHPIMQRTAVSARPRRAVRPPAATGRVATADGRITVRCSTGSSVAGLHVADPDGPVCVHSGASAACFLASMAAAPLAGRADQALPCAAGCAWPACAGRSTTTTESVLP
jgi:hypothetical protein